MLTLMVKPGVKASRRPKPSESKVLQDESAKIHEVLLLKVGNVVGPLQRKIPNL